MRAPGATPTTPKSLSSAPTVPATCVPWPLLSAQAERSELEQLYPPAMLRSGCGPTPVSTMATSASTRWSSPSSNATVDFLAPTRLTPFGIVCAVRWMISSGTTAATSGSVSSARRWRASSLAVKPLIARENVRPARTSARAAVRLTAVDVVSPVLSTTMYRPVASRPPFGAAGASGATGSGAALGSGEAAGGTSVGLAGVGAAAGALGAAAGALGAGSAVGSGDGSSDGLGCVLGVGSGIGFALGSAALAGATRVRTISVASRKAAGRRRMGTPLGRASEELGGDGSHTPRSSQVSLAWQPTPTAPSSGGLVGDRS